MIGPVLGGLAALLLLYSQTVAGKPQRTAVGDRDGLLTDEDRDRDPLGAQRNGGAQRSGRSPICCRCVSLDASCNTDLDISINERTPHVGLTCQNEIESDVFGCDIDGVSVSDSKNDETLFDLRTDREESRCLRANGQKTCCDPVTSTFKNHIDNFDNRRKKGTVYLDDTEAICQSDDVGATTNFEFGVACGKRDSRVYFDAGLRTGFTNPGEWPWAVLIYAGRGSQKRYVGSGALLDNDIVATVGHKMKEFVNKPEELVVHVGDWDPNREGGAFGNEKEKYSHVEMSVDCVKIHDRAELGSTLANNVAVLKLRPIKRRPVVTNEPFTLPSVFDVVDLKSAPNRRGDNPRGPPQQILTVGEREGLLSDNTEIDGLGAPRVGLPRVDPQRDLAPSYINTVCLPEPNQFTTETCWVAAWGSKLERQREVDIPLMTRSQCQRELGPEFRRKGVNNWRLNPSDLCAGGIPGKDTCQGEGGAPLVCYSKTQDQYFAVGLVSYGFGCNSTLPGVYTNLMDRGVQGWIKQAFGDPNYCEPF